MTIKGVRFILKNNFYRYFSNLKRSQIQPQIKKHRSNSKTFPIFGLELNVEMLKQYQNVEIYFEIWNTLVKKIPFMDGMKRKLFQMISSQLVF